MQAGRRYSLYQTTRWTSKYIVLFIVYDSIPVFLYHFFDFHSLHIPWQPISLIGIAVAFYLGFKNNSSYERLWEARKIWGGIVNASRSFTVMIRDFIISDSETSEELMTVKTKIVHRHIAWLKALSLELRKVKDWEHTNKGDSNLRKKLGSDFSEDKFEELIPYLSAEDYKYIMSKGNRSSHLLSIQSKHLINLRQTGKLDHFRHLAIQNLITEFFALQGKSERIKNFPFPRQYATVNFFFVVLFIILLPFGMLDVFTHLENELLVWLCIPFTVVCSWVFWTMEMIGDYSENPFEGLYNDVPISQMSRGIEIDIRQMLDEVDLPEPLKPDPDLNIYI